MKRKLSPLGSMIAVIVALSLVILMLVAVMPAFPVSGSGTVEETYYVASDPTGYIRSYDISGKSWSVLRAGFGLGFVNGIAVVLDSYDTNNEWNKINRVCLAWDISSSNMTSLDDLISATVRLRLNDQGNNFTNENELTASLFRMTRPPTNGYGGVLSTGDWGKMVTNDRVTSEIVAIDEYSVDDWIEFPINQDELSEVVYFDQGWAYVVLNDATYDATGVPPIWEFNKLAWMDFYTEESASKPELILEVVAGTAERTLVVDGNAATDNDTTGAETADNITWQSPRAGYADEGLYFKVNGESGAVISLELQDEFGTVLKAVGNSIRVDGNYDYNPDLPDSWYGWVRLLETRYDLVSDWGYQMPKPATSQVGNTVYAVNTEYPQYEFAFTRYLTYENDAFVLHWKTNIQSDEHADHNLKIWTNTDNLTPIFDNDFEWLNSNYFNASDNNSHLNHWRYMVFAPNIEGSGFEDYDGMIYDLETNYTNLVAGYVHAVVVDTTDNSTLADSHSCYWYIPREPDGIITRLSAVQVAKGGDLIAYVQVGAACQAKDTLPILNISIINDENDVMSSTSESFVESELNEYVLTAPTISGEYVVRFTFSGDDTWDYIHDIPFDVGPARALTGADSIIDSLEQWIVNVGMDNPVGYWVILLVGMLLLFLVTYKQPILRVVLPLVFLGLMMIWGKVDTWLIVLLALGAGLTIWGIFRRKAHGGGGGEGDG